MRRITELLSIRCGSVELAVLDAQSRPIVELKLTKPMSMDTMVDMHLNSRRRYESIQRMTCLGTWTGCDFDRSGDIGTAIGFLKGLSNMFENKIAGFAIKIAHKKNAERHRKSSRLGRRYHLYRSLDRVFKFKRPRSEGLQGIRRHAR